MLDAELPCGPLRYRVWGAGADVVLLHGLLGNSRQWAAAADLMAPRFRCWALELPGIGASARPRDLSLHGLGRWLEWACAALPLGPRFSLIGSSWGGAAALDFTLRSPMKTRVRRLVLAAPVHPFWRPNRGQRFMLTPVAARVGAWLGAHASAGMHRTLVERIYGDPGRVPPDSIADYGATLRQPHLGAAVAACGRHFARQCAELRAALASLAVPVLLVWGDRDPVVPAVTAARLASALPHAVLRMLPGLGHLAFVEDPPQFVQTVAPFLETDA